LQASWIWGQEKRERRAWPYFLAYVVVGGAAYKLRLFY